MSRVRSGKVLVSFGSGIFAPDLDSRTDLDSAASAVREMKNFRSDIFGGANRRAGLQFVAAVRVPVPFDYVSYEGSGTIYGITEFGDLSDPPRKYLLLESNKAAVARRATQLAPDIIAAWNLNSSAYENTAGTRIEQISFVGGNVTSGALTDVPGQLGSASLETLDGNQNSFEDVVEPTDWLPYPPVWTRNKTEKHFDVTSLDMPSGETRYLYHIANSFLRIGGNQGTARGLGVREPTFVTDHWEMIVDVGGDGVNLGTAIGPSCYCKIANGNADPGTVASTDFFIGKADNVPANSGPCFGSFALSLPPNCSVRFMVHRDVDDQVPQQIGTVYSGGTGSPSGLTDAAYDGWLYLPATDALPWKYQERLANEDTMEAALIRGAVPSGTADTAETTAYTGGITAESVVPITFTARTSRVFKTFTGLITGHRYEWTVNLRTSLLPAGAPVDSSVSFQFVASSSVKAVSYLMQAPVGYRQRTLGFAIDDLGPEPVTPTYESETLIAYGKVLDAGSTWNNAALTLANNFVLGLKSALGASFSKINYLLPFIGPDLAAGLVPLLDPSNAGLPTNIAFVNGDFSQTTGLTGNGTTKRLVLSLTPNILGAAQNGGYGVDALAIGSTGEPMGCYNAGAGGYFVISFNYGVSTIFYWGNPGNPATQAVAPSAGFYLGQRSAATLRTLYKNGASVATNTTNDTASGGGSPINVMSSKDPDDVPYFWNGRASLFLTTDGSLTGPEVSALNTVVAAFRTAAGR